MLALARKNTLATPVTAGVVIIFRDRIIRLSTACILRKWTYETDTVRVSSLCKKYSKLNQNYT